MRRITALLFLLLSVNVFSATKLNIAVTYFKATEGIEPTLARSASILLESYLEQTKKFKMVDRAALDKILAEQELQQGGCTSQECAVKLGNILNVQRIVIGELLSLTGQYKMVVKFIDVELGSLDEEVGTVNESFSSDNELEDAIARLTKVIESRIVTRGKVQEIDGTEIYVDLGMVDNIVAGQEVKIIRYGKAILGENGDLIGRRKKYIGTAKCMEIDARMCLLEPDKDAEKNGIKKGDIVMVVISEKMKKKIADNHYKVAEGLYKSGALTDAVVEIDRALSYFPDYGKYRDLETQIKDKMNELKIEKAEEKVKREKKLAKAKSKSKRSGSSRSSGGSSRSRSSRSYDMEGMDIIVAYNMFFPRSGKHKDNQMMKKMLDKPLGGITLGVEGFDDSIYFYGHGDFYFFLNEPSMDAISPALQSEDYKNRFRMFDIRVGAGIYVPLSIFRFYAAMGVLYKLTTAFTDHKDWDKAARIRNWGLGAEVLVGFTMRIAGPIKLNFQYVRQATGLVRLDIGSDDESDDTDKDERSNVSGRQLNFGLSYSY